MNKLNRILILLAALLLVGGCASTTPSNVWRDPNYSGPPFRTVFVIGLSSKDLTDRRGFEDLMVASMRSAGMQAVPAYQYLSNAGPADEESIRAAFMQSGADAVLLARFMGFSTQNQMTTAMVPDAFGVGYGGGYGPNVGLYGAYSGWYELPIDQQVQVATIYTTLFNGRSMKPVWTFDPQTFDPANRQQQANGYANEVAGLLRTGGLVWVQ